MNQYCSDSPVRSQRWLRFWLNISNCAWWFRCMVALAPHSFRIPTSILTSGYCLCGVSVQVIPPCLCGFPPRVQAPPISQKHVSGANECANVCEWSLELDGYPIQAVFLHCIQFSWDKLQVFRDHDQDAVVTNTRWLNEWWRNCSLPFLKLIHILNEFIHNHNFTYLTITNTINTVAYIKSFKE